MTKEFQMTNVKTVWRAAAANPRFGLGHFLVIRASSLVISQTHDAK
jgi:hypothetical protein